MLCRRAERVCFLITDKPQTVHLIGQKHIQPLVSESYLLNPRNADTIIISASGKRSSFLSKDVGVVVAYLYVVSIESYRWLNISKLHV